MSADEAFLALAQQSARNAEQRAQERAARVAEIAEYMTSVRFEALWRLSTAAGDRTRRARTPRPSAANTAAATAAGHVEGMRDAACALFGCNAGELYDALEIALAGADYTTCLNRVNAATPNMTRASHLR